MLLLAFNDFFTVANTCCTLKPCRLNIDYEAYINMTISSRN